MNWKGSFKLFRKSNGRIGCSCDFTWGEEQPADSDLSVSQPASSILLAELVSQRVSSILLAELVLQPVSLILLAELVSQRVSSILLADPVSQLASLILLRPGVTTGKFNFIG